MKRNDRGGRKGKGVSKEACWTTNHSSTNREIFINEHQDICQRRWEKEVSAQAASGIKKNERLNAGRKTRLFVRNEGSKKDSVKRQEERQNERVSTTYVQVRWNTLALLHL